MTTKATDTNTNILRVDITVAKTTATLHIYIVVMLYIITQVTR